MARTTSKTNPQAKALITEGARLARLYARTGQTQPLRELAVVAVELRGMNTTAAGDTDWSGRTPGYREAMAAIFTRASIAEEAQPAMSAALRYHIGNRLREVVSADELQAASLRALSPNARKREGYVALREAAGVSGYRRPKPAESPADAARVIRGLASTVDRVSPDMVAELSPRARTSAAESLRTILDRAAALLAALETE